MDFMGGHLLTDQASRFRRGGPFTPDSPEDQKTPSKDPEVQPRPAPTKIPSPMQRFRSDVPPLMEPQSLRIQPQAPIPGLEVPGAAVPGENGRPPQMPGVPDAPSLRPSGDPQEPLGRGVGGGAAGWVAPAIGMFSQPGRIETSRDIIVSYSFSAGLGVWLFWLLSARAIKTLDDLIE
jgi:hypothetical protein